MIVRSFCSGIGTESLAWGPLGWRSASFSEIDPFCCSLLKQRYPDVPNLGDMEAIDGGGLECYVVLAGTPCQSFSVAVRRLTPRECERLQGFPDDYTQIEHNRMPAADYRRYQALGNAIAVPVLRWIGERIAMVESTGDPA